MLSYGGKTKYPDLAVTVIVSGIKTTSTRIGGQLEQNLKHSKSLNENVSGYLRKSLTRALNSVSLKEIT